MHVIKTRQANTLTIEIKGSIEENLDFSAVIGQPPEILIVQCRNISRINSAGIKSWIQYFQHCKKQGTQITFTECSIPIVEQINLVSNFTCGGKVESITIPFFCTHCKEQSTSIYTIEQLTALAKTEQLTALDKTDLFKDVKCTRCQCGLTFDDNFDTYLAAFFTK